MAMFALASLAYFLAAGIGWGPFTFRYFYLFGAILNVPYLALGTVYLLGGERRGDRTRRALNLTAAFCAGVVLTAPIKASLDVPGIPSGKEVFGVAPRVMAAVGSGVASVVLIGGAVWSAVKLLQLRQRTGMGQQRLNQCQTQSMTAPLWRDVQTDQRGVMPLFDPVAPLKTDHAQQ